jgi:dephospho-CoA kinase
MTRSPHSAVDDAGGSDQRQAALSYVAEAFAEAMLAGIESDSFAHAALSAALHELVSTFGEEEVALFAELLPKRLRNGEFSTGARH